MASRKLDVDFGQIQPLNGSQQEGFEEFCCQLASRGSDAPKEGVFKRYRGAGSDGGVDCVWQFPDGDERGWQADYFLKLNKGQLDASVETALDLHPTLTRYTICIPFNFTGPKKGPKGEVLKSEVDQWAEVVAHRDSLAAARKRKIQWVLRTNTDRLDRLLGAAR